MNYSNQNTGDLSQLSGEELTALQVELNRNTRQNQHIIRGTSIMDILCTHGLISISPDGNISFRDTSIAGFQKSVRDAYIDGNNYVETLPHTSTRGVYVVSSSPTPSTAPQLCPLCQSATTNVTTTTFNIVPVRDTDMTYLLGNTSDEQLISLYGSKKGKKQISKKDLAAAKHVCLFTTEVEVLPSSEEMSATQQKSIDGKKGTLKNPDSNLLTAGCPCCLRNGIVYIIKRSGSSGEVGKAVSVPKTLLGLKLAFRTVRDHMLECPLVPGHIKKELLDGLGDVASAANSEQLFATLIQELPCFTTATPIDNRKRTADEAREDESNGAINTSAAGV